MIEAVFHKFGYIRCSNDKLNSFDEGLAIDWLVCFNIRLLRPSGPIALLTLRVFRMSLTSDSEIWIWDNTESVLLLKFSNGILASSISETDIKKLFRAFAFSWFEKANLFSTICKGRIFVDVLFFSHESPHYLPECLIWNASVMIWDNVVNVIYVIFLSIFVKILIRHNLHWTHFWWPRMHSFFMRTTNTLTRLMYRSESTFSGFAAQVFGYL